MPQHSCAFHSMILIPNWQFPERDPMRRAEIRLSIHTTKQEELMKTIATAIIATLVIASGSIGASAGIDFQENAVTYPQRGAEGTQSGVTAFRPGIDR
jgi:hypothetical protein